MIPHPSYTLHHTAGWVTFVLTDINVSDQHSTKSASATLVLRRFRKAPAASAAKCVHSTFARNAARRISIMQPKFLRLLLHLLNLPPDFFLLHQLRLQLPLIQRNHHTVYPVHCLLHRLRLQHPLIHRNHHNVHHVLQFSLVLLARHSCPFFNVSEFPSGQLYVLHQCCLRRNQGNSIAT